MFIHLIGISGRILNLNHVVLVEEKYVTIEGVKQVGATVVLSNDTEFDLNAADAAVLFDRLDIILNATDDLLNQTIAAGQDLEPK